MSLSRIAGSLLVLVMAVGALLAAATTPARHYDAASAAQRLLPRDTQAVVATDWAAIRDDLGTENLVPDARRRDLASRSLFALSPKETAKVLGFGIEDLDFETIGISRKGAVVVFGPSRSVATEDIEKALIDTGYRVEGDRFTVDPVTLGRAGLRSATALANLEVRDGLVIGAESADRLDTAIEVLEGERRSLAGSGLGAVVDALAPALTYSAETGRTACRATNPSTHGGDRGAVEEALRAAGDLRTYSWSGRALSNGGSRLTIAMSFKTAGQAAEQAAIREKLSTGPYIGRDGLIEDDLRIRAATWDGTVASLVFDRDALDAQVVMTGQGPMLFASCG